MYNNTTAIGQSFDMDIVSWTETTNAKILNHHLGKLSTSDTTHVGH
jgi:hypothetical protein